MASQKRIMLPVGEPVGEPTVIHLERTHKFEARPIKPGNKRPSPGCAVCGNRKDWWEHIGAGSSINVTGSGGDWHIYQGLKQSYEDAYLWLLHAAKPRLPTPCARIYVEAQLTFPDRIARDQDNFRGMPVKALGDALQAGGYLMDDNWHSFEVGGWQQKFEKGVSMLSLMIMAWHPEPGWEEELIRTKKGLDAEWLADWRRTRKDSAAPA